MNSTTMLEKNLVVHVPENQQTVTVKLEIETSCRCAAQEVRMTGSYIDAELPGRP